MASFAVLDARLVVRRSSHGAICAVVGLAAITTGLYLDRQLREPSRLGLWRQLICWGAAYPFSLFVMGMVPVQAVDLSAQQALVTAVMVIGCLVLLAVMVRRLFRALTGGEFRFNFKEMFWFVSGFAALIAVWPAVQLAVGAVKTFNVALWLQSQRPEGIDAELIQLAVDSRSNVWQWAFVEWGTNGGPIFGIVMALVVSALWFAMRRANTAGMRFRRFFSRGSRPHWAAALRLLGASALVACLCWAIVYLVLAPEAIRLAEEHFQQKMGYVRDPESHFRRIDSARTEIREAYARLLE